MGAQIDSLPEALVKRHKVISLSEGGSFIVERWTLAKTLIMASWLAGAMKDITGFDEKKIEGRTYFEIARDIVLIIGDKLPEFMGMAVNPTDRAMVMELPADDAMEVLDVIVELNITQKFVGKVKGLYGRFKSMLPAATAPAASKSI